MDDGSEEPDSCAIITIARVDELHLAVTIVYYQRE